jgi:hypothetical protein
MTPEPIEKTAFYCLKVHEWCIDAAYECPELKYGVKTGCHECEYHETRPYPSDK